MLVVLLGVLLKLSFLSNGGGSGVRICRWIIDAFELIVGFGGGPPLLTPVLLYLGHLLLHLSLGLLSASGDGAGEHADAFPEAGSDGGGLRLCVVLRLRLLRHCYLNRPLPD